MVSELMEPLAAVSVPVNASRETVQALVPSTMSGVSSNALRETGLTTVTAKAGSAASTARDTGEKAASNGVTAPDFDGRLLSDEYGFVLL